MKNDYYVYVFIDPRDFREFYYGMGCAGRKDYKWRNADTDRIIQEIEDAGEFHLTRVVAKGLAEEQAKLVEKTLLWKLGHGLTNKATGSFSKNFRPEKTMNVELPDFDFQNRIFFLNVDEGDVRNWDDWRKYDFISAGQNWEQWGSRLYAFKKGDIICAYQARFGYVGIGEVVDTACPAKKFSHKNIPLYALKDELKQPGVFTLPNDARGEEDGEHLVRVRWIKTVPKEEAKWRKGTFYFRQMCCSLDGKDDLIEYLEQEFDVPIKNLLKKVVAG